ALSIGLAACFNAALLFWQLRKQQLFQPLAGWGMFLIKVSVAVLVMAAVLHTLGLWMPEWTSGHMLSRVVRLLALVAVGAATYFVALVALGFRLRDYIKRVKV